MIGIDTTDTSTPRTVTPKNAIAMPSTAATASEASLRADNPNQTFSVYSPMSFCMLTLSMCRYLISPSRCRGI